MSEYVREDGFDPLSGAVSNEGAGVSGGFLDPADPAGHPPWTAAPAGRQAKTGDARKGAGGKGGLLFSALFLCVSLAAFAFSLAEHPFLKALAGGALPNGLLSPVLPATGPPVPEPVASYLSFSSREALAREAFALMEKKKSELLAVERAREELEKERNSFAGDMERRRDTLVKYSSVLEVARPEEKTAFFDAALRRRIALYHALYERRKTLLRSERVRLEGEIRDLAAYRDRLRKSESLPVSPGLEGFFAGSAERTLLNRLFFQLERGEHSKAIETLEALVSVDRKGANRLQADLLRTLLEHLEHYRERSAALRKGGGFDELKTAFVAEDYGTARKRAAALSARVGSDRFILPALAEFQGAVDRNERLSRDAEEDIATKDALQNLTRKALALEKGGDVEKALKIYREILIFDLSAEDRERIVEKIVAFRLDSSHREAKRRENTKASAYLERAKLADREGREKEAEECYRKIILECPASDYGGEALARLLAISRPGGR